MSELVDLRKRPQDPSLAVVSPISARRDHHRKLQEIFAQLGQVPPDWLAPDARATATALEQKFQESRFHLVLLGQFKRGKTSLLNALVGIELLPTGVLPVTSIVTIVRYGKETQVRVRFLAGETLEIALSRLPDYVTEKGNPHNAKGVAEVEVFVPSSWLEEGLCLIDTPGIASIFEHNTQVSYEFVPKADAAIFVFSPESPLSQPELEFLHHIRGHVEKIFFVMNKADQVTDAERAEILEFARHAIREQMPAGELRLFAVSARQALLAQNQKDSGLLEASRVAALVKVVKDFVASHSQEVLTRSSASALRRILRDELLGLELEARALVLTAEELTHKIRQIDQTWQAMEVRRREVEHILRAEIRALETMLERQLNGFVQGEELAFRQHMQAHLEKNRQFPNRQLVRSMEEALRVQIAQVVDEWRADEERTIRESFETLTSRFAIEAQKIVDQIQQAAAEQFGFTWQAAPLPERLSAQSAFSLAVEELTTWGLGRFPLLLPRPLFFRYLNSRLRMICSAALDRHAGRLRTDLGDRLEQSAHDFLAALNRYVLEGGAAVLDALHRAATLKEKSELARSEVGEARSARRTFLAEIDAELQDVLTNSRRE